MVAERLEELMTLKENGGKLWYEAAVCGGIPIVKTMDQFYNHEPIQELSGIFNGSSNYILSRVEQDGLEYQQALYQAQDMGFAESDPLTRASQAIATSASPTWTASPSATCTAVIVPALIAGESGESR